MKSGCCHVMFLSFLEHIPAKIYCLQSKGYQKCSALSLSLSLSFSFVFTTFLNCEEKVFNINGPTIFAMLPK